MRLRHALSAIAVLALSGCGGSGLCMFVPCDAYFIVTVQNPCDSAVEVAYVYPGQELGDQYQALTLGPGESDSLGTVGTTFDIVAHAVGVVEWSARVAWEDIPVDTQGERTWSVPVKACAAP